MSDSIPLQDTIPEGEELEQFARDLEPFDPPSEYRFEPEFNSVPPRQIPSELYQGRYCSKKRLVIVALLVSGLILVACRFIPIVQTWGLYVLPLQYLHWIGVALVCFSGIAWIRYLFSRGPLVYVEEGIPCVARVIAMFLRPKVFANGMPSLFEYVVFFQYRNPETGDVVVASDTHDLKAMFKDETTLSYQVGDYVTAVHLRANPTTSIRLYGFLDLRPNLGIVKKEKTQECPIILLVAGIVGIAAFFFVLFWNIYAYGKFKPIDTSFQHEVIPLALGAVLLGGTMIGFFAWGSRRAKRKLAESNQEAVTTGGTVEVPWQSKIGFFGNGLIVSIIILFGSALLGGLTMLCWAYSLNSLCDSSPVTLRPVVINGMRMTTHNFLIREYTIEYRFADDPADKKREMMTTPRHMSLFAQNPNAGTAIIRQGFLGWPWVETVSPVIMIPKNGNAKPDVAKE